MTCGRGGASAKTPPALLAPRTITDTGTLPDPATLAGHRRLIVSPATVGASCDAGPPGAVGRRHRALARRRLRRGVDDYLRFAGDLPVPSDINAAERDIRMANTKQEVSGCIRTLDGAQAFAALRSYPTPAAKHGHRPFDVQSELAIENAGIPVTG